MSRSASIAFSLGDKVCVSPTIWPEHKLKTQPGDLSKFAPCGNGVYGYQNHQKSDPFVGAPLQEPCGGTIYFGNGISKADFESLMRILEVQSESKNFAVFTAESNQPYDDRYLVQMRMVSRFGLRHMFEALTADEYEKFPEQKMAVAEVMWLFIEKERERWGMHFWQDGEKGLQGFFGGDGYLAREELSFGFMVENDYHHIYRIWSRAWLVTK